MQHMIKKADFADIHYEKGELQTFSYRFGTAVYEEIFDGHRLYSAGWNGAGYTLNVLEDIPSRLHLGEHRNTAAFRLEANGSTLEYDWEYVDFVKEAAGECGVHGILVLKSALLPLTVRVHTVLDGTGVMERFLEIVNEDKKACFHR